MLDTDYFSHSFGPACFTRGLCSVFHSFPCFLSHSSSLFLLFFFHPHLFSSLSFLISCNLSLCVLLASCLLSSLFSPFLFSSLFLLLLLSPALFLYSQSCQWKLLLFFWLWVQSRLCWTDVLTLSMIINHCDISQTSGRVRTLLVGFLYDFFPLSATRSEVRGQAGLLLVYSSAGTRQSLGDSDVGSPSCSASVKTLFSLSRETRQSSTRLHAQTQSATVSQEAAAVCYIWEITPFFLI